MGKTVAIIGAGPIGLEAALYATELGFEVAVFEKGTIGENIRRWGHVSLFSPWTMNHSPLGVRFLKQNLPAWREPAGDSMQTGGQYVESYLAPLGECLAVQCTLHAGMRVLAVSRREALKSEFIGSAERGSQPFRILTEDRSGRERVFEADYVLDASGVYDTPNWLGTGGIPAIGERSARRQIDYHLRDVCGKDRERFAGKRTLLVGAGYSAATTVRDFGQLIREVPGTALLWAVRDSRNQPIPTIPDDPLPSRASLTAEANHAASGAIPGIEFRNNTVVESVEYLESQDRFRVGVRRSGEQEVLEVDRVIANVGFGPDNSIYRELQVHECWATRGPMKLAASLLSSSSADCLAQTSAGAETLKNPEPNFFIIGNKSYGRNSTFLLRIGFSQVVEVFSLITGKPELNLYEQAHTR